MKNRVQQSGFTLIELTVVLLVLIGLAGALLPYVQGFVGRTHDATGADNIKELSNAIQRYDAQFAGLPGNLDTLIGNDGSNEVIADYLMQPAVATAAAVTQSNMQSLFRGGIDSLLGMCDSATDAACTDFNPTFNYNKVATNWEIDQRGFVDIGATGTLAAPGANAVLAELTDTAVETACGITADPNAKYLMFGVGQGSDMTGKTISDAPVHFAQVGAMNANNKYNRFVAIIAVDDTNTPGQTTPATLACTAMSMMQVEGLQQALARHYERSDG